MNFLIECVNVPKNSKKLPHNCGSFLIGHSSNFALNIALVISRHYACKRNDAGL